MLGAALLALVPWQERVAVAPSAHPAADTSAARAAQVGTIRARQVAAVNVGEPLDGVLLDVQWVSAEKAMALVARERTELVMYELRESVWTVAHAVPVPASVTKLAGVWIRVAPIAPGRLLVAYSGEVATKPRTIVLRVELESGAVREVASWPFRARDVGYAGADRFCVQLQQDDRRLFLITDATGLPIAASDESPAAFATLGAWDEPSQTIVCFGYEQLVLLDLSARVRARHDIQRHGNTRIVGGALDGACYFGQQSDEGFSLFRFGDDRVTTAWEHPRAVLWAMVGGPGIERDVDVRVDGISVEVVSVDSLFSYTNKELVRSRDLTGLAVRHVYSSIGGLLAARDGKAIWLVQSTSNDSVVSRFDVAALRELSRTSIGCGYLEAIGEACDGSLLCVPRLSAGGEAGLVRVGIDGAIQQAPLVDFTAYHGCIDGREVVRRDARLDELTPVDTPRHLRPRESFATVVHYRPCMLADGGELRIRKHVDGPVDHHDRLPAGYWTFEHRGREFEPRGEGTFRADLTSCPLERFSASGHRALVRYADHALFLYDAESNTSSRVEPELPAPGAFQLDCDAVICEDGKTVILWDGECGKLRKLRLLSEGE